MAARELTWYNHIHRTNKYIDLTNLFFFIM